MKKIIFITQVVALTIALPLLSILELKHSTVKNNSVKAASYVAAPAAKKPAVSIVEKMPS